MRMSSKEVPSLQRWFAHSKSLLEKEAIQCAWLGQAGFLLKTRYISIALDPYLSDSLGTKYRGREFPHMRMMGIPIRSEELEELDVVVCSHGHTDHMDKETLLPFFRNGKGPLLIAPRYELPRLLEMGLPPQRLVGLSEYESLTLPGGLSIQAIPAAHETRDYDQWGNTKALGFLLDFGFLSLYHSGDTLPFADLQTWLAPKKVDICLLPVNGRKDSLSQKGILGNFSIEEAGTFAQSIGATFLIPHHFGMFDFNTVEPEEIICQLETQGWVSGMTYVLPHIDTVYTFKKERSL